MTWHDGPRLENPLHTGEMPWDNAFDVTAYPHNCAWRKVIGHIPWRI
jgi:hypothetical protein